MELWNYKLQKTLTLGWSNDEKAHIENLLTLVKNTPGLFDTDYVLTDQVIIELYKWVEFGVDELKWSQGVLYALCMTPELINEDKSIRINLTASSIKTRTESGTKTCNCRDADVGYTPDHYWSPDNVECRHGDCSETTLGCGILWLQKCLGVLYEK